MIITTDFIAYTMLLESGCRTIWEFTLDCITRTPPMGLVCSFGHQITTAQQKEKQQKTGNLTISQNPKVFAISHKNKYWQIWYYKKERAINTSKRIDHRLKQSLLSTRLFLSVIMQKTSKRKHIKPDNRQTIDSR